MNLTAARLTPRGRGAVATVRVAGDLALLEVEKGAEKELRPLFRAANGRPLSAQRLDRVAFGHWGGDVAEEVVLCRVADDVMEFHCHGGEAAVARILADLAARGAAIVSWTELAAAERGVFAAECDEALARATTFRAAKILLEQRAGTLRNAVAELLRAVTEEWAVDGGRWTERPAQSESCPLSTVHCPLLDLLAWADFGRHLVAPWEVVLVGRPNVGKSSLTNALLGFARSIVFDRPGTTRDVVTAETALDGWPVRFADTAGLRDAAEELEAAGVARTRELLARADLLVLLLDVGRPPEAADRELLASHPTAIRVAHKCDLADCWGGALPADALRVSSTTGDGVDALARAIVARLVPRVPPPGTAVPFTERQIALLRAARAAPPP
ncbi:MAG: GTPase, partial [Planctomycetales bacterium]